MADEKKPSAPPPPAQSADPFVELVWTILAIFLALSLINGFINSIRNNSLFSSGWSGLTTKGIMLRHTLPLSSLENPIGVTAITLNKTSVYNSPGGNKIGEQKAFSRGKVLQGPVTIEGVRYWYVDFQKDPDGWVKDSDVAYLESEPTFVERIILFIISLVWFLKILAVILSLVFIGFVVYSFRKINNIHANTRKLLYPESPEVKSAKNPEWERVLSHIESENESDWKLAIIEADIMLAALLVKLSLKGETIGDQLKSVEKSDFRTLDKAWEAHKIRNQIAHEGASYKLSKKEALRVLILYKEVFEEFQII